MYSPTRHWVLIGEIMEVSFFIRPRVTIKTQYGETVLVNFHLDTPTPSYFTWEDLKPKCTLAIFYAVNRTFVDMNNGVRQENDKTVMVFPCPLGCLADEFERYVSLEKNVKACFYCGKLESDEHKLLKCTRCKHVFYCGRDCQIPHWSRSHKSLCKYAPMLANLSKLDFLRFDDFVNWSFPAILPPTAEEKNEKAKKALRETLYKMGAAPTGGSMHSRVGEFLSLIEGKDTASAVQILCSKDSPMMTMLNGNGIPLHIRDTFLFKSLKGLTCAVEADPDLRHHVVDLTLTSNESGGYKSKSTNHFTSDIILSALFAAIPLWQHEESVGGISWAFESHYPFYNDAFKSSVWWVDEHNDCDSLLIKNRLSGTSVFMSDNMQLVAEVGKMIAEANLDQKLIRVIRVTANESWSDCVRSIATQDDLPSNVYTLWIREDEPFCGRFNPLNPAMSLVEQLLDRQELSLEALMLERLGIREENIIRRDSSDSETESQDDTHTHEHTCYSCGEIKSAESFSDTQRRRYGNEARCRECASLSTL